MVCRRGGSASFEVGLGGDTDFDRLEFDGRRFYDLGNAITLATALRAGYARAHGEGETLPVAERFYVGGASTHRGFHERELGPKGADGSALGGTSYLLANVELRAPLLGAGHPRRACVARPPRARRDDPPCL